MEPSYPAIDFSLNVQPRAKHLVRGVWLSDLVEGSGSVTMSLRGQQLHVPWILVPTKGISPFPGLAVPQVPALPWLSTFHSQIPGPELDGGRRPSNIGTNFPPIPLSQDIKLAQKCQHTGDWLNNWDLSLFLQNKNNMPSNCNMFP